MGHIHQKPSSFSAYVDHFGGEASADQPPLQDAKIWLLRALFPHALNKAPQ